MKNYDSNRNVIEDYDVLACREEFTKKLKKKKLVKIVSNKNAFATSQKYFLIFYLKIMLKNLSFTGVAGAFNLIFGRGIETS